MSAQENQITFDRRKAYSVLIVSTFGIYCVFYGLDDVWCDGYSN